MKLNAAVRIQVSQTEAVFEDEEGRVAQLEFANAETTSFDSFVNVVKQGAAILKMTPDDVIKHLDVLRVSIPAVVDTIMTKSLGTRIGLIVTDREEKTILGSMSQANPMFDSVISREMLVAVREEINDQGQQIVAPERDEIRDKVRYLLEYGAGALVVGFKNGGLNPVNEKTVKEFIESDYPRHYLGAVPVFISSDFGADDDDFRRTNRCLLNVYCWAGVDDALSRMETYLRDRKFAGTFLVSGRNGAGIARAALSPLDTSNGTKFTDRT